MQTPTENISPSSMRVKDYGIVIIARKPPQKQPLIDDRQFVKLASNIINVPKQE